MASHESVLQQVISAFSADFIIKFIQKSAHCGKSWQKCRPTNSLAAIAAYTGKE